MLKLYRDYIAARQTIITLAPLMSHSPKRESKWYEEVVYQFAQQIVQNAKKAILNLNQHFFSEVHLEEDELCEPTPLVISERYLRVLNLLEIESLEQESKGLSERNESLVSCQLCSGKGHGRSRGARRVAYPCHPHHVFHRECVLVSTFTSPHHFFS